MMLGIRSSEQLKFVVVFATTATAAAAATVAAVVIDVVFSPTVHDDFNRAFPHTSPCYDGPQYLFTSGEGTQKQQERQGSYYVFSSPVVL